MNPIDVSPPKKQRRSSFFERRVSATFVPPITSDVPPMESERLREETKRKELKLYSKQLKEERAQWKAFLSERTATLAATEKLLNEEHPRLSLDRAKRSLRPEHAAFLKQLPDYEEISQAWAALCQDTTNLIHLKKELAVFSERAAKFLMEEL